MKWSKHDLNRKYNKDWEKLPNLKGWLTACNQDPDRAYCNICRVSLRAHKTDLIRHSGTDTHRAKADALNPRIQPQIKPLVLAFTDERKIADLKLSAYVASHSAISAIDHLGELLKKLGSGSVLERLQLHRTKCTAVITKVISPILLEELVDDIGSREYSIILDESTDVGDEKFMAYCVRYFSDSKQANVTDFLGFQCVERATAEQLHINFVNFLKEVKLDIKNLYAIATDGASNLCGVNHSLFTLLKENNPNLQLLKCVCHSLNRCSQKAGEELPSSIEFLLRESRNWFSHSPLRKKVYEKLFRSLNNDKSPPKLTQLSGTRWLVYQRAINTTIKQWEELKTHFSEIARSSDKEVNCFTARTLSNMFEDNTNLFYLHFLNSILENVNSVNLSFQSNNADLSPLYDDLRRLLSSVATRIFKPVYLTPKVAKNASVIEINLSKFNSIRHAISVADCEIGNSLLSPDAVDFGSDFQSLEAENHHVSQANLLLIKKRCMAFIVRLCKELLERFPANFILIEKLRYFTPAVCTSSENINVNDLPWDLCSKGVQKCSVESELRALRSYSWKELFPNGSTHTSTTEFWVELSKITNAVGGLLFSNLARFAITANSLPISNAVVERIFSIMSIVKTKIRNRMQFELLNSILRIRVFLHPIRNCSEKNCNEEKCCVRFEPSVKMLQRFKSKIMYANASNQQNLVDDKEESPEAKELQYVMELLTDNDVDD